MVLRNDGSLQLVRPAVPYATRRGTLGRQQIARLPGQISSQEDDVPVTSTIFQPIELFRPTRISPIRRDPHAPHPAGPGQHGRGLLRHGRRRTFERVLQVPARRRGHHRPAARTSLRLSTPSLRREIGESANLSQLLTRFKFLSLTLIHL